MDTTDPEISFDQEGICNHCQHFGKIENQVFFSEEIRKQKIKALIAEVKEEGKGRPYDCIIGVSGGVDSTYVAYMVKSYGLNPLAIHLDNGWDSELAVRNIERAMKKLDIDLYTFVLDWEEFRGLQLAFLKASTPDSEIPTDHAIVATLYHQANLRNLPYIFSGSNVSTESIMPLAWSQGVYDWRYISSINKKFNRNKLSQYPHLGMFSQIKQRLIKRPKVIYFLDYMDYKKKKVMEIIQRELEWEYYGGKHFESVYTRFFQGYILPQKFNFDKRKAHLSSLIVTGQISRKTALEKMKEINYPNDLMQEDKIFVLKKLGITKEEFTQIMNLPKKTFLDYPSYRKWKESKIARLLRAIKRHI